MRVTMMKSKIHRATVTGADLNYEGSIAIDPALCEAAHLLEHEKVDVLNVNNGARFTTYVIRGREGEILVNGAAARLACPGDVVIIVAYGEMDLQEAKSHRPAVVFVDEKNQYRGMK